MLEPAISVLREKADSRYSLVIMAAKRARDLVDGKPPILQDNERSNVTKPVSIAVNEIAKDMISYTRWEETELEAGSDIDATAYSEEEETDTVLSSDDAPDNIQDDLPDNASDDLTDNAPNDAPGDESGHKGEEE